MQRSGVVVGVLPTDFANQDRWQRHLRLAVPRSWVLWGADSQWHYDEVTDYTNTNVQISWTQWTNNVYGYHRYPNIPPTHETWDYD